MIAKITRGTNPGSIGTYLHGPGKANEHTYTDRAGTKRPGGVTIGGSIHVGKDDSPKVWLKEMRAAIATRPEIIKPVWQCSLRNTATDRTLSNGEWADAAQTFAERLGFEEHPWVLVRHADDHVHLVVSRVSDEGHVWHARNDRRAAQTACTALEKAYGLERAPRQRSKGTVKRPPSLQRQLHQTQMQRKASELEALRSAEEVKAVLRAAIAHKKRSTALIKEDQSFQQRQRQQSRNPNKGISR